MNYLTSYLETKVMGADAMELITMLYERAILSLNIARESIMNGVDDPELVKKKATELCRATEILYYLNDILDRQKGGQISENLSLIYTTLAGELIRANLFNDIEIISKCIEVLNNLKAAWEDAKKQLRDNQHEQKRAFAGAI
ncbi:MAG: flagellar export chaperone FliS [Thermodesulfovibrio sp.]|nr:flagellar export chaperone FliS [Thermodesulfovibrio sp.]MCX7724672.1 flagellar export chaperone FliS [Thermodesulfovibrio sp.]MDW7971863.1 flagellar export chaperone FliS [Thermodesulfovibrio sp.]